MTTRRHYRWGQIFWSGPTTTRWGLYRRPHCILLRLGHFGLQILRPGHHHLPWHIAQAEKNGR
jgi:hypothetical protein